MSTPPCVSRGVTVYKEYSVAWSMVFPVSHQNRQAAYMALLMHAVRRYINAMKSTPYKGQCAVRIDLRIPVSSEVMAGVSITRDPESGGPIFTKKPGVRVARTKPVATTTTAPSHPPSGEPTRVEVPPLSDLPSMCAGAPSHPPSGEPTRVEVPPLSDLPSMCAGAALGPEVECAAATTNFFRYVGPYEINELAVSLSLYVPM